MKAKAAPGIKTPTDAASLPWPRLSEFIAQRLGLHFPPERRVDLQRGLANAAQELGFADLTACARWLLNTPLERKHLQALASHLTIGETYFFRERKTFEALATHVLPELLRRHRRDKHLRLWSAACCTGEEPYSLAILLTQCIPDIQDWRISLLATDVNERFLQKAAAGIYGEWSFRDPPPGFKETYFTRISNGRYALLPRIRQMVRFAPLNLAEDPYPSLTTDTQAMDLILCRNALMYFTPSQADRVVRGLRRSLLDEGCLVVSPTESFRTLFSDFMPRNFPGTIFYQKQEPPKQPAEARPPGATTGTASFSAPAFADAAPTLYAEGRCEQAADALPGSFVPRELLEPRSPLEPPQFSLLARSLANQGKLDEALIWCDKWVAADAVDPEARYLRAVVLEELGDPEEARRCLQQALYLHPDFVLAHFALGNLARSSGKNQEAHKHFANTLQLLRARPPEEALPESDGLTAGRLAEIVTSLLAFETAA